MRGREFIHSIYLGKSQTQKGDIPICFDSSKGGFCLLYDNNSKEQLFTYIESIILTTLNAMPINRCYFSACTKREVFGYLPYLSELNLYKSANSFNDIKTMFNETFFLAKKREKELADKNSKSVNEYNNLGYAIKPYHIIYINVNDLLESGISNEEITNFINISYKCGIFVILSAKMDTINQSDVGKIIRLLPMLAIDNGKFIASEELIECVTLFDNFKNDFEDNEILLKTLYKKAYKQMPAITTTFMQKENIQIKRKSKEKKEQNGIYNMEYENCLNSFKRYKNYKIAIFRHFKFEESLNNLINWLYSLNIDISNQNIFDIKELNLSNKSINQLQNSIKLLQNLEKINLSHNNFDTFPKELLELKSLKEINLSNNQLNSLPNDLTKLQNLQKLDLSFNNLNDYSLFLPSLKVLKLASNNLNDLPIIITNYEKLEALDLSNNNISEIGNNFAKLSTHTNLNLNGNPIYEFSSKEHNMPQKVLEAINQTLEENEEKEWQKTVNINTKEACKEYLNKFKNPKYLKYIDKKTLKEIEFEKLVESLGEWVAKNSLNDIVPTNENEFMNLEKLDLSSKGISNLPEAISLFENLKILDLRNNNLEKLPNNLAKLSNLKELYIGANSLTYLPKNLEALTKLVKLNLWSNKLSTYPDFLCNFKYLKELNCSHNSIIEVSKEFNNLISLEVCDFSNNAIKEFNIPLDKLDSVKSLYLSYNKIKEFPKSVIQLKSLKHLELDNNKIEQLPKDINPINGLKLLCINENELNNIESIPQLAPNIENLSLTHNSINKIPESIDELKNLKELNLNFNKLTKLPNSFSNLTQLESLSLLNNSLRQLPKDFGNLKKLNRLYIAYNKLTKLPESFANLSNLKELDIRDNPLKTLPNELATLDNTIIRKLKDLIYKNEKRLWDRCKMLDSRDSYKIYLSNYPNGIYSLEAKKALKEKSPIIVKIFKKLF